MTALVEADPVAAEFWPLYVQGEAMGHSRAEMRTWPVPYAAVMLGVAAEGDEPVLRGARQVVLPSDVPDRGDTAGRRRAPRPRKRRETGRLFGPDGTPVEG